MSDLTPFERSAFPGGLALRWLTANCYEIRLPNGKTILTDPFLPREDEEIEHFRRDACGYTVDDLHGADYVIITHGHGDHLAHVSEVFEKFACWVLCHSAYAIHISTDLKIPQQFVFPFDNNQHYEFDDFTLDTAIARHLYGHLIKDGKVKRYDEIPLMSKGTNLETCEIYGGMFNSDFVITTKNNISVAFCSGPFPDFERNHFRNAGINVLVRQCGFEMRTGKVQDVVRDIMDTGAELLLPLHHERIYGKVDCVGFAGQVNGELAERGYKGRMFIPERGRWYQIGTCISAI